MTEIDWLAELTRAALPQAVLALLSVERRHGYAMIESLRDHGFDRIKGGTLYPLLRRFEEQGLVDHVWEHDAAGPGRKVFALTALGAKEFDRSIATWNRMNDALTILRTTRRDAR
ncbi:MULTISPECIES: PadR family transcriptional regulator [Cryobacterium]|uniref:PadR family transcriptional regulator n=1 Tax=Cryobacterium breve TaxID=1259258 RepID=A0ABY2IVS3_9MICO|nr:MULTISPECIES: PadR family transcriptional regulator [Cryobacterium]TFC93364.1 PadR family transcriptional regulator [Cryobacterium sp. TmT3-12]TFC95699.1 PadR family transcriptional regulator [Cryobacterium breve]